MADTRHNAGEIEAIPILRRVSAVRRGSAASDGAGVRLTRMIGTSSLPDFDPFLLLDEFRSDDPAAYLAGFPDHPHRGFETVTYMLAGRMRHRDSVGNEGVIEPSGVQWMTAGRGLIHSEMPEQEDGLMWGFQLWVNLPAAEKMTSPAYRDLPASAIPEVRVGTATVRIIAGRFGATEGPIGPKSTEPLYLSVDLGEGDELAVPVPRGHAAFVLPYDGTLAIGRGDGREFVPAGAIALLGDGDLVALSSLEPARALVIAGRPLREPVARHGPFVMTTDREIKQAFADFRAGQF